MRLSLSLSLCVANALSQPIDDGDDDDDVGGDDNDDYQREMEREFLCKYRMMMLREKFLSANTE